ncbi:MAG: SPOR domain-containing protein [Phycisphaerae bacterium]|nr:SPOR domain-containing protein [Planctomycetia bacterium]MCK6465836.1 SPOR domain-containing protein [Phycisphaerae bacterium]MCL4719626.1 SPOR domain-containing protein [Phycisphaerae bacterium]NUQ10296.1 SPOR domain-containing protein [Phycisphaerae bacterium]
MRRCSLPLAVNDAPFSLTRVPTAFTLMLAVVPLIGCRGTADGALSRATAALRRQDSASASREVESALAGARSADDRASAYYLRAQIALQQGRQNDARVDLHAALLERPSKALAARIRVQIANLDFDAGAYASAAQRYEEGLDAFPKAPPKDRVLLQYAASLQRSGRFRDGENVLRTVVIEYPGTPSAAQAARKLDWRLSTFTVQCGAFRDERSARAQVSDLRNKGFPARAVRAPSASALPWVVHCGQFPRFADAQRCLADVRRLHADAFIVP